MERGDHERERRHSHHDQCGLKQEGIDLAAPEPRVHEEQREHEDRNARCGERMRAIDVSCCKVLSHGQPPADAKSTRSRTSGMTDDKRSMIMSFMHDTQARSSCTSTVTARQ